jgi:hypothetical protein
MHFVIIFGLLAFWLVLAARAFQRGDMGMAALFVVVGIALTVYRLRDRRPASAATATSPAPPKP